MGSNTGGRSSPKCCDGGAKSHEIVFRQSFEAETTTVDEVNRNQAGCARNRSVAGSLVSVATLFGSRHARQRQSFAQRRTRA